jgi:ADP-ribose pyrophosphatase YjhB (NUDIX family)
MKYREHSSRDWLPGISVDCVLFAFHEDQLKYLTLKFLNSDVWSLAGGYVGIHESMNDAARRILEERSGLRDVFLEQYYCFGDPERNLNARTEHEKIKNDIGSSMDDLDWLTSRFITIGYFAVVEFEKVNVSLGDLSDEFMWQDVSEYKHLFLDHNDIVDKALLKLREGLDTKLITFKLLPETFTMSEIQKVYEIILGIKIVRTNFQRKILSLGILDRIEKKYSGGAHKAPYLYRLKK